MKVTVVLRISTQDQHPASLQVRNLVSKNCENVYFRKLNAHSNAGRNNAKTNSLTSVVCYANRTGIVITPCHVHSNALQVCLVFKACVLPLMSSQFEQCVCVNWFVGVEVTVFCYTVRKMSGKTPQKES